MAPLEKGLKGRTLLAGTLLLLLLLLLLLRLVVLLEEVLGLVEEVHCGDRCVT
jgi:hypothetical protein